MADYNHNVSKFCLGNESRNEWLGPEVLVAVLTQINRRHNKTVVEEVQALAFRFACFPMALLISLSSNTIAPAWVLLQYVERSDARHSQFAGS